jgi:hypothetical protein
MPTRKRPKRTQPQRRKLRELNEARTKRSLRTAYVYGPGIRWCQKQRWSQRQMVAYFTERGCPLPSDIGVMSPKIATSGWHLGQIQRLLKQVDALRQKMIWKQRYVDKHSRALTTTRQGWKYDKGIEETVSGWLAMIGPRPAVHDPMRHGKRMSEASGRGRVRVAGFSITGSEFVSASEADAPILSRSVKAARAAQAAAIAAQVAQLPHSQPPRVKLDLRRKAPTATPAPIERTAKRVLAPGVPTRATPLPSTPVDPRSMADLQRAEADAWFNSNAEPEEVDPLANLIRPRKITKGST